MPTAKRPPIRPKDRRRIESTRRRLEVLLKAYTDAETRLASGDSDAAAEKDVLDRILLDCARDLRATRRIKHIRHSRRPLTVEQEVVAVRDVFGLMKLDDVGVGDLEPTVVSDAVAALAVSTQRIDELARDEEVRTALGAHGPMHAAVGAIAIHRDVSPATVYRWLRELAKRREAAARR